MHIDIVKTVIAGSKIHYPHPIDPSKESKPRGIERSVQRHDSQAPSPRQRRGRRVNDSGRKSVRPLAKHKLQVSRHALEDDGGDGDEWAVFHTGGEDSVFLTEEEGGAEGAELRLRERANDDIDLEEGVKNVDVGLGDVGLREGVDF